MEAPSTSSSRTPQPCSFCETIGYPTNKCPKLKRLKYLLHAPQELVNPLTSIKKKNLATHYKALHTNHACAFCAKYGHYTHSCPKVPRYKDALVALTQPSSSLLSTEDGSKNIFYVVSEEASCSSHATGLSTSTHNHRRSQQIHTSPLLTCALCDTSEHLINQCIELRDFNRLYPIPYVTQPTTSRYKRHTCQIYASTHHVWHFPHLSRFRPMLGFMRRFIMKNSNFPEVETEPSRHSLLPGNEATRSILCVFKENRLPATGPNP